jgi:hypothetical protein
MLCSCAALQKRPAGPQSTPYRPATLLDPSTPRLLIEIDYVEGYAPKPGALKLLAKRMELYLDKPGGIEIVLDDVLPREAWTGTAANIAKNIRAHAQPPTDGSAYIYAISGPDYKTFRGMSYRPGEIRGVDFPAMALFKDKIPGILWVTRSRQEGAVLLHEVGHLVGLVTNDAHRNGGHCTNGWCLMYSGVDWRSGLIYALPTLFAGQIPTKFCKACRQDLWADQELPGER